MGTDKIDNLRTPHLADDSMSGTGPDTICSPIPVGALVSAFSTPRIFADQ
jgi:hypothetical protein